MSSQLPPDWSPQYIAQRNIPITRALCHDGTLVTGRDTDETRKAVVRHLRQIDFLPANALSYFETAACRAQASGSRLCRFHDEGTPVLNREARVLRLGDVLNFLGTAKRWFTGGCELVDQQEAQRRADICQRCPMNMEVGGCSGCVDFAGQVLNVLGDRRVQGISTLRSCGVCACSLPALVFMPLEVLSKHADLPGHCWQKQNSPIR